MLVISGTTYTLLRLRSETLDAQLEISATYAQVFDCLLYTSDAADDLLCVDLGGRRIIKKKILHHITFAFLTTNTLSPTNTSIVIIHAT